MNTVAAAQKTHKITFWLVITDNMRRFGYKELEPRFDKPFYLDDLDDCREFETEVPEDYVVGPNQYEAQCLWDASHDMSYIAASVNKSETTLSLLPLYAHGDRGPIGHYPIKFVH
ncbi:MAG: hypothetical protein [Caudoviricetes sp.]|nr:MAG: hypothetical protein [Caudoviricetes sp.]